MFEPWQLAAIDDAGYNGIRDEYIERVATSLLATGLIEIDHSTATELNKSVKFPYDDAFVFL